MATSNIYPQDIASIGIKVQRDGAAAPIGRRVEMIAFAHQPLFEQRPNDAADGGAREASPARHGDAGEGTILAHAVEDEEAIERAHRAEVRTLDLPLGATATLAGLHATDDVADSAIHSNFALLACVLACVLEGYLAPLQFVKSIY